MLIHYRKAKKGDISCKDCRYSQLPTWPQKRLRCFLGNGNPCGYAIGKNMTCDSVWKPTEAKQ